MSRVTIAGGGGGGENPFPWLVPWEPKGVNVRFDAEGRLYIKIPFSAFSLGQSAIFLTYRYRYVWSGISTKTLGFLGLSVFKQSDKYLSVAYGDAGHQNGHCIGISYSLTPEGASFNVGQFGQVVAQEWTEGYVYIQDTYAKMKNVEDVEFYIAEGEEIYP